MSTWIEASLHDAVSALIRSGEKEIAAAIGRLLGDPGVKELQLYRAPEIAELADELFDCESIEALHALLPSIAAALGALHCTIHCVRDSGATVDSTRVLTTYSAVWLSEYIGKRYFSVDPVMERCLGEPGTFFWDELRRESPMASYFFEKAAEYGVGPSGVTFLSSDPDGNPVAVTLAGNVNPAEFRQAFRPRMSDFADLAALMIEVFADLAKDQGRQLAKPSDDQLKVLRALICGRSLEEIGQMRFAYGSFTTVEKSILQTFGARTLHQAAALAARIGLLDEPPLFEEDILPGAA